MPARSYCLFRIRVQLVECVRPALRHRRACCDKRRQLLLRDEQHWSPSRTCARLGRARYDESQNVPFTQLYVQKFGEAISGRGTANLPNQSARCQRKLGRRQYHAHVHQGLTAKRRETHIDRKQRRLVVVTVVANYPCMGCNVQIRRDILEVFVRPMHRVHPTATPANVFRVVGNRESTRSPSSYHILGIDPRAP
jgi:hypothetical protein